MAENTTEVMVGAAVVAVAISFATYMVQSAGLSWQTDSYPLTASFRSLEGVAVGSDVKLAGVKVGTVTDIVLSPETYRAQATVAIDTAVQIPDDSAIVVASEGLLGGNYVEISPGASPFFYAAGDEVLDTQGAVSLITLLLRYVGGDSAE